jgi:hypothetical protein
VDNFWIGAVDNWVGWGNRGKKNEKGVGGPFPGVHRQLRMILIQQFIFKTSTHLTITNASPRPQTGLQATIMLSLWDDKDNALKRCIGPQSKIVEMAVGIDDLQEASRYVATACRQQDGAFSITKGALEVLNCWSCFACHHHLSKK